MTGPVSVSTQNTNAQNIYLALDNLRRLIDIRLKISFGEETLSKEETELEIPMIYEDHSPFAQFIQKHQPSFDEYILLLIALAPHVKIDFFDQVWNGHLPKTGDFPNIGGQRENTSRAFLPTIETALFILADNDLEKRFEVLSLLDPKQWLIQQQVLEMIPPRPGDPRSATRLTLSQEFLELLTIGHTSIPELSSTFPAQHIHTQLDWEDLVLPQTTISQIKELKDWVDHNSTLMNEWGMGKKLKQGYRALFYGPPGTGKTLTASLLGRYTGKEVFRIDLSMVVSKYIGETEKNLGCLFDKARNKNWILFFDEADALFGKRTEVKDAHDRFANQEVSYLLQRIENFNGLVILSSNFKTNIDDAFTRRFNAIIPFSFPRPVERLRLWEKAFPAQVQLAGDIDLMEIAERYKLSGANIMNVVHYLCLRLLALGEKVLSRKLLVAGIQREFEKEGKVM